MCSQLKLYCGKPADGNLPVIPELLSSSSPKRSTWGRPKRLAAPDIPPGRGGGGNEEEVGGKGGGGSEEEEELDGNGSSDKAGANSSPKAEGNGRREIE